MEYGVLSEVIGELAGILPGAHVDKVVQAGNDSLALLLRRRGKNFTLLIAADRSLPRIHLLSRKTVAKTALAGFFLSLKKHLDGSTLSRIGLLNEDRVVGMEVVRLDETIHVIFELFGSSANIILTDGEQRIVSVLRPVPPGDRATRPLIPGIRYEQPPRTGPARPRRVAEVTSLRDRAAEFSANRAVEEMYDRMTAESARSALRQRLGSVLNRALSRTGRRRDAVRGDLEVAQKGDEYRLMGEVILANLDRIARGQERADLQGHDGTLYSVVLDVTRTPAENAEKYFRKYKKAKAGRSVLGERLEEATAELRDLTRIREELDAADSLESLDAVRAVMEKRGLLPGKPGRPGRAPAAAAPYRTVSFQGWEILVGRSAAGNDYVTLRLARPDDLWLHAEGIPGSHVVVRNPQKRDIPPDVLRRAASLAAYYSKGRGSAKVPVAYTAAKNVKKPKGAAQGTVVLRERKSIMAVPAPEEGALRIVP